ncbi:MAG: aminoglycoside phosphotransferase family protein [Desulfocapsaceae bacterium]|nr:aminoglycoside phosphotransferase family protein [Desulfocapsaceae bacterium]
MQSQFQDLKKAMQEIIAQFCDPAVWPVVDPVVTVLGVGNINDTWLVRRGDFSFVLQRLSRQVFLHPHLVMANLATLSRHFSSKVNTSGQRWEHSVLLPTNNGAPFYTDHQGDIWRAVSYIDMTTTHQAITTPAQARQVGWALGHFHSLLADLPVQELHETLPGFHILPCYLDHFDRVLSGVTMKNDSELRFCFDFVAARRKGADLLEQARHQGKIRARTIHGDPKVGNVLFDISSDCAVSLIDLDTVGPGLIHYDIGDCLRSCCNVSGEEAADLSQVVFDVELCREVLAGYFSGAGDLLLGHDRELIFHAVRLISFELGLRFLTDYLAGNCYFKVSHEVENLHRALVQFHLVQSIENRQEAIEKIASGGNPATCC